jgi:hypothetical protein
MVAVPGRASDETLRARRVAQASLPGLVDAVNAPGRRGRIAAMDASSPALAMSMRVGGADLPPHRYVGSHQAIG